MPGAIFGGRGAKRTAPSSSLEVGVQVDVGGSTRGRDPRARECLRRVASYMDAHEPPDSVELSGAFGFSGSDFAGTVSATI